jgi:hypothetical protein
MNQQQLPVVLGHALWSTQRALLSEVTPDLRVVTVEVGDGIRIRCIYDRPIDEDLREIASVVEGEVIADFLYDLMVEAAAETQMDGSITLTASEVPVYRRRESNDLDMTAASTHPGGHPDFLRDDEPWTPQQARQALGWLAVQAALLGEVTPDLRAVTVDPTEGVRVRLIYDHPIDAATKATVDLVDAATRANLHLDTTVIVHAESVPDGPIPISGIETPTFHRREEPGWIETDTRQSRG